MFNIFKNKEEIKVGTKHLKAVTFEHRGLKISAIHGHQFGDSFFSEVVIFPPDGERFEQFIDVNFASIGEAVLFADKIADAISLGVLVLIDIEEEKNDQSK
jgi:hypothetical protein